MTAGGGQRVLLLTQDCACCEQAKDVVRRVSADVPLAVDEVDLSTDLGTALAQEAGVLFAPGVFVDGLFLSHGRLSERKLRKALARPALPLG